MTKPIEKDMTWPEVGQHIRFTSRTAKRGFLESITGTGVVASLGCGIEGMFITISNGHHIHLSLGDTWASDPVGVSPERAG